MQFSLSKLISVVLSAKKDGNLFHNSTIKWYLLILKRQVGAVFQRCYSAKYGNAAQSAVCYLTNHF
jgi:hypothetical protein